MNFRNNRHSQNHMHTTFDLTISCPENEIGHADETLREAHQRLARLETELSEFLPQSPVYRLNESSVGVPVPLPASTLSLLQRAEYLKTVTRGAFDPGAKGKTFGRSGFAWDLTSAWRLEEDAHLGFGAIGKGFALDTLREILEREGFYHYCLSAGGSSIVLSGFQAPRRPWKFGWSWKRSENETPQGLSLTHFTGLPVAIGVSGTQEQGRHLMDPLDRRTVDALESAFVGHTSATEADALSTALFVAGWEKTFANLGDLPTPPAMAIIPPSGIPQWNGTFQKLWGELS